MKSPGEPPTHIGASNDIGMIQSYGGPGENQQSSTTQGSTTIELRENMPCILI